MAATLPRLIRPFAERPCRPGVVCVQKDALSLIDKGSRRLGVDPKAMSATFVVTSNEPDRVGDVVESLGIDLANFRQNPIGFYGHQVFPLPIGKWEDPAGKLCVWPEKHRTVATLYFSQRSREAAQIFDLVVENILRATSIGFNPLEDPVPRGPRESNPNSLQQGYRFRKVDLLEISVVGIPAHPSATMVRAVLARNRLAGAAILAPIRKSLEALAEPAPAWSNGADMSKKWGKTRPKKRPASPAATEKALIASIPAAAKSALQECVSRKVPKLLDEGKPHDQAIAIAFSMCGEKEEEEGKDMSGASGTEGGYTVGPDDEHDKAAVVAVEKRPPQAAGPPQNGDNPAGPDGADPEGNPQAMPDGSAAGTPEDRIGRIVQLTEALLNMLEADAKAKAPPPDLDEDEDEDEDEEEAYAEDDEEEAVGKDRYEFRADAPSHAKGKYHAAAAIQRCKDACTAAADHLKDLTEMPTSSKWTSTHKSACAYHHKELTACVRGLNDDPRPAPEGDGQADSPGAPGHDGNSDSGPVEKFDLTAIMAELGTLNPRIDGVARAWNDLNGAMP